MCTIVALFDNPMGHAAEETPEISGIPEGQNLDQVLETLNESLEDNRNLRESMLSVQTGLERMTVENNVLRAQIANLEKKAADAQADESTRLKEVEAGQASIFQLQQENKDLQEKMFQFKAELESANEEKKKAMGFLDQAILESERDEMRQLIATGQAKAEDALEKLAAKERENQQIGMELTELYYRVGNVLFESKNYEGAVKHYKKALDWDPSHAWAHHNIAVIYDFYLDDHARALYHYGRYLDLKPAVEEAHAIRERILELDLTKEVVPEQPLNIDFNQYHASRK